MRGLLCILIAVLVYTNNFTQTEIGQRVLSEEISEIITVYSLDISQPQPCT